MRYLLSLFLLIFSCSTYAQYTMQGKLIDENDQPIIGATIQVIQSDTHTVTDENGAFSFQSEKQSTTIKIQYIAFSAPIIKTITAGKQQLLVIGEQSIALQPVFISEKYPVTHTTLSNKDLESKNLGQDIPLLLEQLPSVVSTSDAGAGIGYSGIRVRGSDATRVNVTVNGIPLNDSESQGVFWVNMPDFASSTGKLTLVRGAGSSTNGAGAFGASLHLQTNELSKKAFAEYNGSVGSFNTFKNNIQFGTGKIGKWSAGGRLSKITSDGFIDRASSDLQSYFLQVERTLGQDDNGGRLKLITFKGHEETYQAWYGVREDILESNRTYNPYTYENQVDNYRQEHYQLLWDQPLSNHFYLNTGLHYTKGKGYFEEFKAEDELGHYGISPFVIGSETITTSDLVRRRWLDNDFYGFVSSGEFHKQNHLLTIGGGWNNYLGGHFGEVISGEFVPSEAIGQNYYANDATKQDWNVYGKYTYDFKTNFGLIRPYIDLQYRNVHYDFVGLVLDGSGNIENLPQSVSHRFFNPKAGLTVEIGQHQLYASYAKAQKEPNRNDYTDSPLSSLPKPEELDDFELGYTYQNNNVGLAINGYFMDYTNQLALTGGVNDVGEYSRVNVPDSYRMGVEFSGNLQFGGQDQFTLQANAAFSKNKIKHFKEYIDDYDNGGLQSIEHYNTDLALSPNQIVGGSFSYQPNKQFKATILGKYVGKQYLDNTSTNSRSIDAYWVNNLNVSSSLGQWIPAFEAVDVNVLVNNIFDTEYESNGYTFGYIYEGQSIYEEYFYPQAGRNYLLGLTLRFEE